MGADSNPRKNGNKDDAEDTEQAERIEELRLENET